MVSVNNQIQRMIYRDISLQKCLKKGIVNVRSLAKFLIQEHGLKYSLDSVISAIRRYNLDEVSSINIKETQKLFKNMSIHTKDNIAKIILRDHAFKTVCEDYLGQRLLKRNSRIIRSKETITLIISQKEFSKKVSLFKPNEILDKQKNLSEIRLEFHKDVSKIQGIIARIATELSLREINIEDVIYSIPNLLIYVKEKNLVNAHKVLTEIKKD